MAGITGQLGSSPQWNSRRGKGSKRALLRNVGCSLLVVHDQEYNTEVLSHSFSSPGKEIAKRSSRVGCSLSLSCTVVALAKQIFKKSVVRCKEESICWGESWGGVRG